VLKFKTCSNFPFHSPDCSWSTDGSNHIQGWRYFTELTKWTVAATAIIERFSNTCTAQFIKTGSIRALEYNYFTLIQADRTAQNWQCFHGCEVTAQKV
jgi:hypothetical protein